jgi:Fic family protein
VDATKFVSPKWGRAIRTPPPGSFAAFIPQHVPRELTLSADTVMLLSEADAALGRLAGSGRIEGTQASVTEVFDAAATGETKRNDIREVRNYVAALQHGVRRLKEDQFPISLRLIKEMHEILLTGVRGQDKTPGEFRTSQMRRHACRCS